MDNPGQNTLIAISLLKTARGQVDATLRMVEEDRNCINVSKQVHASIALLKKANFIILRQHLSDRINEAIRDHDTSEKVEEITMILERYLDR